MYITYLIRILVFLLMIAFSTILEKIKDSVILKIIKSIDKLSVQQLYKEWFFYQAYYHFKLFN